MLGGLRLLEEGPCGLPIPTLGPQQGWVSGTQCQNPERLLGGCQGHGSSDSKD